jgi:hypothetical protein
MPTFVAPGCAMVHRLGGRAIPPRDRLIADNRFLTFSPRGGILAEARLLILTDVSTSSQFLSKNPQNLIMFTVIDTQHTTSFTAVAYLM